MSKFHVGMIPQSGDLSLAHLPTTMPCLPFFSLLLLFQATCWIHVLKSIPKMITDLDYPYFPPERIVGNGPVSQDATDQDPLIFMAL